MTRDEILEYFKDINYAYNDCTRHDTLKRMIDELQSPCTDAISRAEALSHAKTDWGNGHEQPFDYVEVDVIKQLLPVTPKQTFEGMTNGKVMKALFPKIEVKEFSGDGTIEVFGIDVCKFEGVLVSEEWWNAPYRGVSRIEASPTRQKGAMNESNY